MPASLQLKAAEVLVKQLLGPFGPSWGDLGGLLGRLGASESRKGENAKNFKTIGKSMICASLGPLGGPVAWAVLEASWEPLGAIWARLGALLGPKKSREKMRGSPGGTREAREDLAIWGPGP